MDLGLKGRVALVAAASKGLGYGVAQALAREGALLSICSRTDADIQAAAARLREETGNETLASVCDMRDAASIEAWVAATVTRFGRIDAVLVNAGGPPAGYLRDFDDGQWQAAFELILMSAVRLVRAALPHLSRGSAILTVTSSSISRADRAPRFIHCDARWVAGFVKTLADELAGEASASTICCPGASIPIASPNWTAIRRRISASRRKRRGGAARWQSRCSGSARSKNMALRPPSCSHRRPLTSRAPVCRSMAVKCARFSVWPNNPIDRSASGFRRRSARRGKGRPP